MAYKEYSEVNASEGFHTLFTYTNEVTNGLFSIMILFALFVIVALGSYYSQQRTRGKGDMPVSFAVAGFFTTGASFIMMIIPNMINGFTVAVTVTVTIFFTLWLMLDKTSQ